MKFDLDSISLLEYVRMNMNIALRRFRARIWRKLTRKPQQLE